MSYTFLLFACRYTVVVESKNYLRNRELSSIVTGNMETSPRHVLEILLKNGLC